MDIEFTSHSHRQLKKIPAPVQLPIKHLISQLQSTPFPPGFKKLSGREGYRLRFGSYRVLYNIYPKRKLIIIITIAHRREIYR